jgi:hypothetical protein
MRDLCRDGRIEKIDLEEIGLEGLGWIFLAYDRDQW